MTLPAGFRFRPARDDDVAAVTALVNVESQALIGARLESEDRLLRRWTAPSVDRERDVSVVEGPGGGLCGYLSVEAEPPYTEVFAYGAVALPFHGRGLGAAIVGENERRARRFFSLAAPGRRVVVHAGALAGEPKASTLLASRGYRLVRRFQLMRIDFAGAPVPPASLTGIELRSFVPGDERRVYDTFVSAFADHWGEGIETYEGFRHYTFDGRDFDPALWQLAWDGDTLAGVAGCLLESVEDPSRGYVGVLGVRASYRRRGIGEALLRQSFRVLHERGRGGCDLHVDAESLTGATRLYERLGMTAHPRFAAWEKELRPGPDRGS